MKEQYDIGLICLLNNNYGNNLTYYALYRALQDKGYSTILIEKPLNTPWKTYSPKLSLFRESPFEEEDLAKDYGDKASIKELNDKCRVFVLGSDQLLRNSFIEGLDFHTCMDWVRADKYKMAYATSFGVDYFEGRDAIRAKMAYYLERFDAISVREDTGKLILKEQFGVLGECVIDPVFLCSSSVYYDLASKSKRQKREPYIGAYILDPSSEKEEIINALCEQYDCYNTNIIGDGEQTSDHIDKDWNLKFAENCHIEDWLANIEKSELFVTDSFHGLCFALIFQKNFYVVFKEDGWRGRSRMYSLLSKLGLQERIISEKKELPETIQKIDYSKINTILTEEITRSYDWLVNHIEQGRSTVRAMSAYDILDEKYDKLDGEGLALKERLHGVDNWIYEANDEIKDLKKKIGIMETIVHDLEIKKEATALRLHGKDNWIGDVQRYQMSINAWIVEVKQKIDQIEGNISDMFEEFREVKLIKNDVELMKTDLNELKKGKIKKLIEKLQPGGRR